MRLIANNDGTWSAHDETYDIIIRCGTKEENERVMELLKKCVRDFDQTVIMITHNEALIGDCDRILHIRDGVLTEEKHNEK